MYLDDESTSIRFGAFSMGESHPLARHRAAEVGFSVCVCVYVCVVSCVYVYACSVNVWMYMYVCFRVYVCM